MASNLRKEAAKALGAFIAAQVPEFNNRFLVGQPDPEKQADFAGLVILPGRYKFESESEEEVDETLPTRALVEVGSLEGSVEVRIYARHAAVRDDLEQKVLEALVSREGSPGTIVVTVPGIVVGGATWGYAPSCTYSLAGSDWQEEFAFEHRRYSFIELDSWLPMLVARNGVYTIEQMALAVTNDMTTEATTNLVLEQYQVAEDGTVTPYP
jgi:hypothetical protein